MSEFAGKRVTVMGLGRFGGGVGVTRFLVDRGADVLLTDKEPADVLEKSVAQIQGLVDAGSVTLRLGEHNVSDFTTCDLVVVNPAVPPGNRFVRAAEAAGIEVTTEMRLLVERLPNRLRTIGVTGSAGKSTVTAMIGHVLNKVFSAGTTGAGSRKVWVGGNIGGSLLPHLDEIGEDDWVVLELSSFMLDRLRKDDHFPGWSPHIALITNISPNHLDWHGSMEDYVKAKQGIFDAQDIYRDVRIVGPTLDLQMVKQWSRGFAGRYVYPVIGHFFKDVSKSIRLPGKHNKINAELALIASSDALLGDELWAEERNLVHTLSDFYGLPHRLQLVAEIDGVRYYNDSKCTTPEAAKLAIQAFIEGDDKPGIHLILGGYDKGSDFASLAALASETCKAVYTIGQTGDTIAGLVENAASRAVPDRPNSCGGVSWPAETAEVVRCGELEKAMDAIRQRIKPGDVVLLSTGSASWGQFDNYEQRGERFIELVKSAAPPS